MQVLHMDGAGNDFMVLDGRGLKLDYASAAKTLCAMTGADGFMVLDDSQKADFRLHFYNSDGSRGEMCGNGSRCICRFAYDLGIAGEEMSMETDAGLVYGKRLGENHYRVRLNNPGVVDLNRLPGVHYVELGNPGLPLALTCIPDLQWEDRDALREQAKTLRFHPAFPKGANVIFYCETGESCYRVLAYERGVEDYTLACGTGCGSLGVALSALGQLPDGHLICENPGGVLEVTVVTQGETITELYLEGPADVRKAYQWDEVEACSI